MPYNWKWICSHLDLRLFDAWKKSCKKIIPSGDESHVRNSESKKKPRLKHIQDCNPKPEARLGKLFPIGSMYGIFTYIYHKNQLNVGEYTSPMDPMGFLLVNT